MLTKFTASGLPGKTLFILLLFSICSCTTPHYMYAPTAVNVPAFTDKGQSDAGIALSTRGVDGQVAYAITNHLAISGSSYWRDERQYDREGYATVLFSSHKHWDSIRYKRTLWSAGLTYYTAMDQHKRLFLILTGGYGSGRLRMKERSTVKQGDTDSVLSRGSNRYYAKMNRIYLQPAIMGHYHSAKIIFSLRVSGIIYHGIRSSYPDTDFNITPGCMYVFSEPALSLHITPPATSWLTLKFQSGFVLPSGAVSFKYRSFIGNVGAGVDVARMFRKKPPEKQLLSLR